jgi:hypothetical protein
MANNIDLERAQTVLGYHFNNLEPLVEALTAADKVKLEDGAFQSYENNRRIGKVGEAAIKLILAEDWYNGDEPLSKMPCSIRI